MEVLNSFVHLLISLMSESSLATGTFAIQLFCICRFSKEYPTVGEKMRRFALFAKNMRELKEREEAEAARGNRQTLFGITPFFDWSDEELTKASFAPSLFLRYLF